MARLLEGKWALILGGSSGFGEAACRELARRGANIAAVHLDRRDTLAHVDEIRAALRAEGVQELFFNANAADDAKRTEICDVLRSHLGGRPLRVLFHSLAFGTLCPFVAAPPGKRITRKQLEMTLDVMANSLVYWVQDLEQRGLLGEGTRIFAMTSAGGTRVWPSYGAVSAAKAALEAHVRQLAVELAPRRIAVNALRAGITDTPSLRKIPGHEEMLRAARERNPGRRITMPQDVAEALAALAQDGTVWMTGNVIGADGGEFIV